EERGHREPRRLVERADDPVLVRPERTGVAFLAAPAADAACAEARPLLCDRRLQGVGDEHALEGPGVPFLDRRCPERSVRALPERLRRLRHLSRPSCTPASRPGSARAPRPTSRRPASDAPGRAPPRP